MSSHFLSNYFDYLTALLQARVPPISLTYLLCCNTTDLYLYLI